LTFFALSGERGFFPVIQFETVIFEFGHRTKANPGAVVYDSAKPKKASGGMIRVSKILTRYHQELEVQEDEPGESILLRPNPQG
jgi:hypothetical protein